MCNVIVQRTRGTTSLLFIYLFSSPVVLNNKNRYYVLYGIVGWLAMEKVFDARESSWGRCTWQVRLLVMASFGAWELGSNGVSRNRR